MGQSITVIKPLGGMNTDIGSKFLKPDQVRYRLNQERTINNYADGLAATDAYNTPTPSNRKINMPFKIDGVNLETTFESKLTNETYVFVWNSASQHHIYRINQRDNSVQMVLLDPRLNFQLDPRHSLKGRIHLFVHPTSAEDREAGIWRKYLVWTDGLNWQGFLDVETAIATGGFSTNYFKTTDRRELWTLAPRPPLDCPYGSFNMEQDFTKQNFIANKTWQFRIKYIYTDGRVSAWSPYSTTFILNPNPCAADSLGRPRCIDLRIPLGGPGVEQVILAFRNCAGNFTADQNPDCFQTAIINKYDNCLNSGFYFYDRHIRDDFDYDPQTNTCLFQFCNEGTCIPLDKTETNLNYNDIPFTSYCLLPLDNRLGLVNNQRGLDNLDCNMLKLFKLTSEPIEDESCKQENCKVKVAVLIHNLARDNNEPIFIYEQDPSVIDNRQKFFGGLCHWVGGLSAPFDDPGPYNQSFPNKAYSEDNVGFGFIAYVAGADAWAYTKQYKCTGYDNLSLRLVEDNFRKAAHRNDIARDLDYNHYYYISIAELTVPKGTKGYIRLASHLASPTDDHFRETSTSVLGVYLNRYDYSAHSNVNNGNCAIGQCEIYFDTCGMDEVDLTNQPFVVADLTGPYMDIGGQRLGATSFSGYVKDTEKRVVSGALTTPYGWDQRAFHSLYTDHNGFYWGIHIDRDYLIQGHDAGMDIYIEGKSCTTVHGGNYGLGRGDRPNRVYTRDITVDTDGYANDHYQPVSVLVKDSDGLPLSGVVIAMTGEQSATTGQDGYAHFVFRHNMFQYPKEEVRTFIIMQSAVCALTMAECNNCMPSIDYIFSNCFTSMPVVELTMPEIEAPALGRGFHPGGVYPVAIKLMDAAGRETGAQPIGTVTTQTVQELGKLELSRIKWTCDNKVQFPEEFVRMSILIGRNHAFDDMITWVADKVEFVDNSGGVASNLAADKILISIRSLYDYNTFYNAGTNVKYQFVQGDYMEFVADEKGVPFDEVIQIPIQGDYNNRETFEKAEDMYSKMVVGYTDKLKDLKEGALIKLVRPRQCENMEYYYETCATIPLDYGNPRERTGYVNGWDTYLVRRGIRWADQNHSFAFSFFHHSPSDYWGDHCIDRGRFSVENIYAKRLFAGRQLMLSKVWLENSNYNGLGTFDMQGAKDFKGSYRGDITGIVTQEEVSLVILEHDNFLIQTTDEFAHVDGRSGNLVAYPTDSIVSDAQGKIVGNYGCQYNDVGSIEYDEGWVWWVDAYRKCPVMHDWQVAKDVSVDKMQSYWSKKLQTMLLYNRDVPLQQRFRIVSGFDSIGQQVITTFFSLFPPDARNYTHNRHAFDYSNNETIAFCVRDLEFSTMYSFTPSAYGRCSGSTWGNVYMSFMNGVPYLHRMLYDSSYNSFFGESFDEVFEVVINDNPEKIKVWLAMQQQSLMPYYADKITTSLGHESEIPPYYVTTLTEGKYDANFLSAANKDGLFGVVKLRGNWIQVRFVKYNVKDNIIGKTDPAAQMKYNELDRIFIKYMYSEQSAYNTSQQAAGRGQ